MIVVLLSSLSFALAVFALTRRRLLWGVIGVGAHSLSLAGVYFLLAAPDVALTEAAIGFALVTFVYLLALRRTGKLVVAAAEAPPLLYTEGERAVGLEWEILERLSHRLHRDLEVLWVPRAEVSPLLGAGEADLAAGGFLPTSHEEDLLLSRPLVPTNLVMIRAGPGPLGAVAGDRGEEHLPRGGHTFEDPEALAAALAKGAVGGAIVDLLRLRGWHLRGRLGEAEVEPVEEGLAFRFAVAPGEDVVHQELRELLGEMEESGELEALIRRYLG